ncbi:MAG: hypothetical protein ACAI35_04440 [Candidatus Methylacidiphilales bacterium]
MRKNLILPAALGMLAFAGILLAGDCPKAFADTYTWKSVRIGGGGNVTSIQAHPLVRNLYFITTDVGTPYRWNHEKQCWEGLFYNRPATEWGRNASGDIAFAPNDAAGNILYATIGNAGKRDGSIIKSTDRGNTWVDCEIPIEVQPNSDQGTGQRLAVDPQNADIVYVTTRAGKAPGVKNGTFKTTRAGETGSWARINELYGNFVQFDVSGGLSDGATRNIYIGCKDGVYFSGDAGKTFALMTGSPANPHRASCHSNGTLFIASGSGVSRWDGKAWTSITPPTPGKYSTVAVNPTDPNKIVCSSNSFNPYRFDAYRSADGGATWTHIETHKPEVADLTEVPWYATGLGQNINEMIWDPFDSNIVWMTDFFFASQTTNAWADTVIWKPRAVGDEETVPLGPLVSPASGPNVLITCLADAGGWDHKTVTEPPRVGMQKFFPWKPDPGKSGGWGNMTGAAVQESNPLFIARVGRVAWDGSGYAGYSIDGGDTYTQFHIPAGVAGGRVAISATKDVLVWVPQSGAPQRSADKGASWTTIASLPKGIIGGDNVFSSGPRNPLAADRVNGDKFYVYKDGRIYVSTDAGLTFTATAASLPNSYISNALTVETTPGKEGDVWVGMISQGLFHSTDSGATFQQIANVQSAQFLAIGKASREHPNTPAVYVFGKVNGVEHTLFRSNDNGATWENLGIPVIGREPLCMAADRRLYGRVYIGSGGNGFFYGDIATDSAKAETR